MLRVDAHPLLDLCAFTTVFLPRLGELVSLPQLAALFAEEAAAPLSSDDGVRDAVRALLRHGGFKPTGRSKPASEYLLKAARERLLSPINLAVDICNIVSLHSGLPISVVDLDRLRPPLSIRTGCAGESYVFNPTGQTIELAGLPCLCDAEGPSANAVKDAQRTKTSPSTRATLTVVWSSQQLRDCTDTAVAAYRALLQGLGAELEPVQLEPLR